MKWQLHKDLSLGLMPARNNELGAAQAQLHGQDTGPVPFILTQGEVSLFAHGPSSPACIPLGLGKGERQEETKERGVENGLW